MLIVFFLRVRPSRAHHTTNRSPSKAYITSVVVMLCWTITTTVLIIGGSLWRCAVRDGAAVAVAVALAVDLAVAVAVVLPPSM